MNRYWDNTEAQRATMTEHQVEACLSIELMEKGVLKVDKPTYLETEQIEPPHTVLYVPTCGYSDASFGFRTPEDAAKLIVNAVGLGSEYIGGQSFKTLDEKREIQIKAVPVYEKGEIQTSRAKIERNNAAAAENKKLADNYATATKAVSEAVEGIWDDWFACKRAAASNKKIVDTFAEYVATCDGNEAMAMKFLLKAYDEVTIRDAFEWFGKEVPTVEVCCAAAE